MDRLSIRSRETEQWLGLTQLFWFYVYFMNGLNVEDCVCIYMAGWGIGRGNGQEKYMCGIYSLNQCTTTDDRLCNVSNLSSNVIGPMIGEPYSLVHL